jgi:hypothetical protein
MKNMCKIFVFLNYVYTRIKSDPRKKIESENFIRNGMYCKSVTCGDHGNYLSVAGRKQMADYLQVL